MHLRRSWTPPLICLLALTLASARPAGAVRGGHTSYEPTERAGRGAGEALLGPGTDPAGRSEEARHRLRQRDARPDEALSAGRRRSDAVVRGDDGPEALGPVDPGPEAAARDAGDRRHAGAR